MAKKAFDFWMKPVHGPKQSITWDAEKKILKSVPFVTSTALNAVAKIAQEKERAEMRDVFSSPTQFTLNGVGIRYANRSTQKSAVFLKDSSTKGGNVAQYLKPNIKGGTRQLKKFEYLLRAVGALPNGMFVVPGTGAEMDRNGNMKPSQITKIVSYFKAFPESGYKANITDAKRKKMASGTKSVRGVRYFVGRPGDGRLPLGIWQATTTGFGSAIKPVMLFVDRVSYEAIFEFIFVAELAFKQNFTKEVSKALTSNLLT